MSDFLSHLVSISSICSVDYCRENALVADHYLQESSSLLSLLGSDEAIWNHFGHRFPLEKSGHEEAHISNSQTDRDTVHQTNQFLEPLANLIPQFPLLESKLPIIVLGNFCPVFWLGFTNICLNADFILLGLMYGILIFEVQKMIMDVSSSSWDWD